MIDQDVPQGIVTGPSSHNLGGGRYVDLTGKVDECPIPPPPGTATDPSLGPSLPDWIYHLDKFQS